MTDKKEQLNNEELEKVSGGDSLPDSNKYVLSRKLDQYETEQYIGSEVAVYDLENGRRYLRCYGTLMRSYEASWGCGTRRTIEVRLHPGSSTQAQKSSEGYAQCFADVSPVYLIDRYL